MHVEDQIGYHFIRRYNIKHLGETVHSYYEIVKYEY